MVGVAGPDRRCAGTRASTAPHARTPPAGPRAPGRRTRPAQHGLHQQHPPASEPQFPRDEHVERRIRAYIRWNAAVMVSRANRPQVGVGGHIATYASAASLYEVGFNHFFRGKSGGDSGDQVFIQGHASPGIYARAYLEGRLTERQLDGFRQELSHPGGGLVR